MINKTVNSDPVYRLLREIKKLSSKKNPTETNFNFIRIQDIPKILKDCTSIKRKIVMGCLSYLLFSTTEIRENLF